MKIACVGYREWALKIYDEIAKRSSHAVLIFRTKDQYDEEVIKDFNPDLILYYGWSWIIKDEIIRTFKCVMLHPSPLPLYRGGSPIQNQIINGEDKSAVTLFLMDEGLDTGDIIDQEEISLTGHIGEIFDRITGVGIKLTLKMINEGYVLRKQESRNATIFKRRTPADSEITIEEIQTKTAKYIFNKIRMLGDPYPNAYLKTADGKKILIKSAEIE